MILDPRGYSVIEWTDYLNDELGQFGCVPKLLDEDQWRDWAVVVCGLGGIALQQPPNPYNYDDWIEWATAFNLAVSFDG